MQWLQTFSDTWGHPGGHDYRLRVGAIPGEGVGCGRGRVISEAGQYSASSILNGDSGLSLVVYFVGALFFIGSLIYIYSKRYKEGKFSELKELNSTYIFYIIFLTLTIIAARGGKTYYGIGGCKSNCDWIFSS